MKADLQLTHPDGKKGIRMSKNKYDVIKASLLKCLHSQGPCSHKSIHQFIINDLDNLKIGFEGSVEWHMEWVKLDLESKGTIHRIKDKSSLMWMLT